MLRAEDRRVDAPLDGNPVWMAAELHRSDVEHPSVERRALAAGAGTQQRFVATRRLRRAEPRAVSCGRVEWKDAVACVERRRAVALLADAVIRERQVGLQRLDVLLGQRRAMRGKRVFEQ